MPYYPLIPQAGDIPAQSQAQILSNFTEIDTDFAKDHVALTDATVANRGFHKYSRYQLQAGGPVTTANQVALYCKNDGVAPNLYFRRAAAGAEIVMTANVTPIIGTTGQSFLAGGLIMKWGQGAFGGPSTTVSFSGGAFPSACVLVVVGAFNAVGAQSGLYVSTWTASDVTIGRATSLSSTYQYTYIAIGY